MLAMADKNGVVEASVPGLSDLARVSVEKCRDAIRSLSAPDRDSRSKEHEGRRILEVDGGWLLVNHAKYRAKLNADDRREYLRKKAIEYRAKSKRIQRVDSRNGLSTQSTQPEAAPAPEADPNPSSSRALAPRSSTSTPILTFPTVGASRSWPLSSEQIREWESLFPGVDVLSEARKALAWVQASPERRKTEKGMRRFLVGWMTRTNDRGSSSRRSSRPSVTESNMAGLREDLAALGEHE